ncbi:MAG: hypothetical protein ABJE95_24330 [Byssovorax sp.]
MKVWIFGGLALAAGIAACSNQVAITAEKAGSTQGAGGSGASATGSGSGPSSGTGAGASGPGKIVTAETDIGQYVSVSIPNVGPESWVKVVEGPFFVTDVVGATRLATVQGKDCSVAEELHTLVVLGGQQAYQLHGMRLPVLPGQSLCVSAGLSGFPVTNVLGFKPY